MKKTLIPRLAVLALALSCIAARAEFLTGNDLYQRLNGTGPDQSLSMGYVAGVFDALHGIMLCPSSSVTLGQATDVVRQFLRDNPAMRDRTADILTESALARAFPCPTKAPSSNRREGGV